MTTTTTSSVKIPPSNNNIFPRTPIENNDTTGSGSPIIRSTSKLGMFSVVSSRDSPVLQRATSSDYLASPSYSADGMPTTPNLVENSPTSSPKPLRSAMSSRTLHESLHRGLSSNDTFSKSEGNLLKRNVSFTQVKIREYERIRGVNSDVYGPPLSIGWRYNTPTELDVSEYEEAKGEPRSSAEYLVPKKVREKILKEHTDDGKGDSKAKEMLGYWDQPGHIPRGQRRHSISFGNNPNTHQQSILNDKKKKSKGMKHKLAKIIKENNPLTKIPPYKQQEDQLWNKAHLIAIEKAKRLEESILNGEKQTLDVKDLYSVGTPLNNVLPSRRNSVPVVTLLPSLLVGDGDNDGVGVEKRRCSAPAAVVQQQQHLSAPQSRDATDEEEQVGLSLSISGHTETAEPTTTKSGGGEGEKKKKIVATEEDGGEGNDTDDDDVKLAQLLYEDAVINDKNENDDSPRPPAA